MINKIIQIKQIVTEVYNATYNNDVPYRKVGYIVIIILLMIIIKIHPGKICNMKSIVNLDIYFKQS